MPPTRALLVPRWCPAGAPLVPYWCLTGALLVPRWCPAGALLVPCWCPAGVPLVCGAAGAGGSVTLATLGRFPGEQLGEQLDVTGPSVSPATDQHKQTPP